MLKIPFHSNLINSQGFKDHGVRFEKLTDNTMTWRLKFIITLTIPIKLVPTTKYFMVVCIFKNINYDLCILDSEYWSIPLHLLCLSRADGSLMVDVITRWSPWRDCIGNMPTASIAHMLLRIDVVSTDSWRWECQGNSGWLRPFPNWRAVRHVISGSLTGLD